MTFWIPQTRLGRWTYLIVVVAIFGGAIVLGTLAGQSDVSANNSLSQRMGVTQIQGQEWAPFSASEIMAARAHMKAHPVQLKSGEVEAAILRTVVSPGDGTAPCGAWGDCWKALVVYTSDRHPLTYHVINAYGADLGLFRYCYRPGGYIILNLRAMQSQPTTLENEPDLSNVSNAQWVRPAYPGGLTCYIHTTGG